ncbi:MAG: hypothetical protein CSA58_01525 [Micrococcales bacterium]|nr:MAG: hypothetical protein CSB46_06335 [Micrococcales bacterium]PIE27948.1 MAG: hypothetical protein CSA58_01525 [Micrococcales bacterium]
MTTAPPEDQARLLDLAHADTRLRQLAHAARSLPEHRSIAELEHLQSTEKDRQVAAETAVSDLRIQVTKAESDVELVRSRIGRDTQRLNAGTGSAKDLMGLQHELQTLAKRMSDLEDVELELMERLESAEQELARIKQDALARAEQLAELSTRRDEQLAELNDERDHLQQTRDQVAAGLASTLLADYDRCAARTGGIGAAAFSDGRCQGCQLQLNPGDIDHLRAAAAEDIVHCEECGCILVRPA